MRAMHSSAPWVCDINGTVLRRELEQGLRGMTDLSAEVHGRMSRYDTASGLELSSINLWCLQARPR